jgi:tetratricopeptide (TPR) repeat protein
LEGLCSSQIADYGREDGIAGYAWVARYTLQFLNAYLKHNTAAMAYLKRTPAENGVPQHFMSVTYRSARGMPATLDTFRAELGREGFDHAAEVYAAMRKDDPRFKLEDSDFAPWVEDLLTAHATSQAIILAKFEVGLDRDSSDAYFSLGEVYRLSGQKQLAIDSYKKSLEKNPKNDEAKEKLKELQAQTTSRK